MATQSRLPRAALTTRLSSQVASGNDHPVRLVPGELGELVVVAEGLPRSGDAAPARQPFAGRLLGMAPASLARPPGAAHSHMNFPA